MQENPMIRLISVDLDGTLLNPKGKVTIGNLEAIRAAQQAGVVFSVATGRFYENACIGIKDMGLDCPVISTNGGKIAASPFGQVIASHKMAPWLTHLILSFFPKHQTPDPLSTAH